MEVCYSLGSEHEHYLVRYDSHEYHTDFRAWHVAAIGDGQLYFGDNAQHTRADDVAPLVAGSVKWDGCANFEFPEQVECMLHTCSREGLTNIGLLLGRIYDQCAALCPKSIAEDAQEVARG